MTAILRLFRTFVLALLGAGWVVACSDSSGPGDVTVELSVVPIASPINEATQTVSGTTDPGARVTVTSPRDTASDLADALGAFSLAIRLWPDAVNSIIVLARDSAGNQASDTFDLAHDGRVPIADFSAPRPGETTSAQSGFTIDVKYVDQGSGGVFVSGVDPATLLLESDGTVGGIFQRDGSVSTTYPPGTNLATIFDDVGASSATLTVPDSLAFEPGSRSLRARVNDLAGNRSPPAVLSFAVTSDPDRLVAVDASGAAGSTGNDLPIALINADTVAGVQFDLVYSAAVIERVEAVVSVDRAAAFGATDFNSISPGRVRVLLFDLDGDLVLPGQGLIMNVSLTVHASAPSGSHTLTLADVRLSGPSGGTAQAPDVNGTFMVP